MARMTDTFATSPDHSQSTFSFLLNLPLELIEIILKLVLHDLILSMKTRQRPRSIISQFRALLLTCKTFKIIIDQGRPRLHMNFTAKPHQMDDHEAYYPNIHFITDQNIHEFDKEPLFQERYFREWSVIFKIYQKVSLRNAYRNDLGADDHIPHFGKFWLNNRVSLTDFRTTVHDQPDVCHDLFMLLANPIQRRSTPIERASGEVVTLPNLEWYLHRHTTIMRLQVDIDPVINYVATGWWKPRQLYSVRDWKVSKDPTLRGSLICPQAKEWWIWPYSFLNWASLHFAAAYVDDKVWVFDFSCVRVYTNFEFGEKVGEFGECRERGGVYLRFWERKWPRHIETSGLMSISDREEMEAEKAEAEKAEAEKA